MAGTAEKGMLRQLSIEGAGGEALLQGGERAASIDNWRSIPFSAVPRCV